MGSLSKASYDIKEEAEVTMEMAAAVINVEDYEEAGLVISAEELGFEVIEKMTVSAGVGLKENLVQGTIVNKGGDADTEQAPEMAATSEEENGKKEWEMEMEVEEEEWPGAWEFERDEHYYQWIWYCPDVFVFEYDQLPNYI